MTTTNLPPVGSVWLGAKGEVRVVTGISCPSVLYESTREAGRTGAWFDDWHEWQVNATCIYDPTAPQPDPTDPQAYTHVPLGQSNPTRKLELASEGTVAELRAECERLRRENERLKDQVIDNDLMRNELEELRMLKSELGDALGGDVDLWASLVQQRNELRDKLAALATPPQGESQ